MLNKKESNLRNLWKVAIILPLLSIFLWGFNTKTETQFIRPNVTKQSGISEPQNNPKQNANEILFPVNEKETSKNEILEKTDYPNKTPETSTNTYPTKSGTSLNKNSIHQAKKVVSQKNTIEFIVNKISTKDDLERIKRIFKSEYEVEITFSDIKRNDVNEITGISFVMSSKKSNANYSIANDTPILPIVISYDNKKEKIKIGQYSTHTDIKNGSISSFYIEKEDENNGIIKINSFTKNKEHPTLKYDTANKKVIAIDKNGNEKELKLDVVYNDNDNNIFVQNHGNGMIYDFDTNSGKKPLFFIDGKKASKKDVKKLKSSDIESVDVSKGEENIKKYGKKAKDGVIRITTKKNAKKGTSFDFKIKKDNIFIGSLDDNDTKPLMFIDGKKVDYSEVQKLDHDQIKSVNVYKDLKAITRFGSEGENGVVEIILKD